MVDGNERADELAKGGTHPSSPHIILPNSGCIFRTKVRQYVFDLWNQEWLNVDNCRQTKIFFPEIAKGKSQSIIRLPRDELSRMVRFLTGHNFLQRHRSIIDPEIDPSC